MDEEIISHFAGLVEDNGSSDIWYTFDTVDLLPPRYKNEADQLTKMYQVFDSWFDSSLSWQHVTGMGDPHKLSPIYD
jgi:isoleucyl-tRNA synthetase